MTDKYCALVPSTTSFGKGYAWWKDGFNYDELAKLSSYLDTLPLQTATTSGALDGKALTDTRRSQIAWVPMTDETVWLYDKLREIIVRVNKDFFGFDLSGLFELQYTVYDEGNSGCYDWHVDTMGPGQIQRKLSFSMMLSDPMDYEGGEFWIHNYTRTLLDKTRGTIHFFPSYCLHRVTDVAKGKRKALVGWVVGPEFR